MKLRKNIVFESFNNTMYIVGVFYLTNLLISKFTGFDVMLSHIIINALIIVVSGFIIYLENRSTSEMFLRLNNTLFIVGVFNLAGSLINVFTGIESNTLHMLINAAIIIVSAIVMTTSKES